jgi:hypothetical protein
MYIFYVYNAEGVSYVIILMSFYCIVYYSVLLHNNILALLQDELVK